MNFGNYIYNKRINLGLSLREFSKSINIGYTYLYNIENGNKSAPSDEIIIKMAKKLELSKEERIVLFDLAAESKSKRDKKNVYVPIDIGLFINKKEELKNFLRESDKDFL